MALAAVVVIGVLSAVGTHLVVQPTMLQRLCGFSLWSHAVHVFILAMGRVGTGAAPIVVPGGGEMVDALPQALILTSIVISFAFTAFLLGCGFVVAKMERSHG